ncbi:MAG: divalent-cation tolerance protein CutA [Gammaproteobacteria bacterium]
MPDNPPSPPPDTTLVVLCTCPTVETARELAAQLVEERLAACVNILPGVESVYSWENRIARDDEVLMLVKTRSDRYPDLERRLHTLHPYELPEIIAVPVTQGLDDYLAWVAAETGDETGIQK